MDEPVEAVVPRGHGVAEPGDLVLVLHVAHIDGPISEQPGGLLPDRVVLHDIDALRPGLFEHAAHVVGDALAVGHAEDQHPLARKLQEVHGRHSIFAAVQANSKRTATFSSTVTLAFKKNASATRSTNSTSMIIVSPGRTMRLKRTSLMRVATGR